MSDVERSRTRRRWRRWRAVRKSSSSALQFLVCRSREALSGSRYPRRSCPSLAPEAAVPRDVTHWLMSTQVRGRTGAWPSRQEGKEDVLSTKT